MWPSASTRPVVLLGNPVSHSLSPAIHNAAFRDLGLDLLYLACKVDEADLEPAVRGLRAIGAAGANLTIPHKEAAAGLCDDLTPAAAAIGAVNTLAPIPGGWRGGNTDVDGFLAALGDAAGPLTTSNVLLFGAGGAARAVAYAILSTLAPASLTIVARSPDRARRLARDMSAHDPQNALALVAPARAAPWVREASLVVNATSAGMSPDVDNSPWPHADDFGPHQLVFDLVYTPAPTRLLRDAAGRGARVLDGREMLVHQAAASFHCWTGLDLPLRQARIAMSEAAAPA